MCIAIRYGPLADNKFEAVSHKTTGCVLSPNILPNWCFGHVGDGENRSETCLGNLDNYESSVETCLGH